MKLVKYEIKDLRMNSFKKTKLQKLLEEFIDSGYDCAIIEYEEDEYSSACSVCSVIKNAIKRFHVSGVACVVRNKKAYLLRTSPDDCE